MKNWHVVIGTFLGLIATAQASTLYNQPSVWAGNGTSVGNSWTSQVDASLSGYRAYDNFSLAGGGAINQSSWRGIYVDSSLLQNAAPNTTDWIIRIQADNAGAPGAVLTSVTLLSAQVTMNTLGSGMFGSNPVTVYEFTAPLPTFTAAPGVTYWFSPLSRATNFSPLFTWIEGTGGDGTSFQTQSTNGAVVGSTVEPGDRAFALSNVPEPSNMALIGSVLTLLAGIRFGRRGA